MYLTLFYSASIVDFEQVNVSWVTHLRKAFLQYTEEATWGVLLNRCS